MKNLKKVEKNQFFKIFSEKNKFFHEKRVKNVFTPIFESFSMKNSFFFQIVSQFVIGIKFFGPGSNLN